MQYYLGRVNVSPARTGAMLPINTYARSRKTPFGLFCCCSPSWLGSSSQIASALPVAKVLKEWLSPCGGGGCEVQHPDVVVAAEAACPMPAPGQTVRGRPTGRKPPRFSACSPTPSCPGLGVCVLVDGNGNGFRYLRWGWAPGSTPIATPPNRPFHGLYKGVGDPHLFQKLED